MFPRLKLSTLALSAGLLTACTTLYHYVNTPTLSTAAFRYGVRGDAHTGLIQAFNHGGRTYLQFLDIKRARPRVYDLEGAPLPFTVSGEYAVIASVVDGLELVTFAGTAVVYALDRPQPPQVLARRTPQDALEAPTSTPITTVAAVPASAPVSEPARDDATLARKTVTFGAKQWSLDSLSDVQRSELRTVAAQMKRLRSREVRVIGYTDAAGSPMDNLRLSEKRAEAVASVFSQAGFPHVIAFGRGPLDQVNDCTGERQPAAKERCLSASRRVVIELHA